MYSTTARAMACDADNLAAVITMSTNFSTAQFTTVCYSLPLMDFFFKIVVCIRKEKTLQCCNHQQISFFSLRWQICQHYGPSPTPSPKKNWSLLIEFSIIVVSHPPPLPPPKKNNSPPQKNNSIFFCCPMNRRHKGFSWAVSWWMRKTGLPGKRQLTRCIDCLLMTHSYSASTDQLCSMSSCANGVC